MMIRDYNISTQNKCIQSKIEMINFNDYANENKAQLNSK